MSNPRLRRLIGRRAALPRGGGSSAPAYLSYAGAQAINADGYTFQDDDATAVGWGTSQANNYDPVGDAKLIYVARPGFTATGAATTVVDAVTVMSRLRQAYANDNLWEAAVGGEVSSTLSDPIFDIDAVYSALGATSLVNNSAVSYPAPACLMRYPDLRVIDGHSLPVGLYVSHFGARNGRPVAAVKFIASDGANPDVEVTVSSMTSVQHASGLYAPWFQTTIDISSLDDGEVTVDYIVYPWIGEAWQASVDGDGAKSIAAGVDTVFHDGDGSYRNKWAMVDAASTGASAAVATTEAACESAYSGNVNTAFATIAAAVSAIETAGGGGGHYGGGVVLLQDGTYLKRSWGNALSADGFPVTVKRSASSTDRASVVVDVDTTPNGNTPLQCRLEDVTFEMSGGSADIGFNGGASLANAADDRTLILANVTANLTGSTYAGIIYDWHRVYLYECDGDDLNALSQVITTDAKVCVSVGCENWVGANKTQYGAVACYKQGAVDAYKTSTDNDWPVGPLVFGHCFFTRSTDANVFNYNVTNTFGLHLPYTIIERSAGTVTAILYVSADGDVSPIENVLLTGLTVIGQRTNFLYNDTGSTAITKTGSVRFCAFDGTFNAKDDTFASSPNGGRWPGNGWSQYGVGFRSNAYLRGSLNGDEAYGSGDVWLGEVEPLGAVSGSVSTPLDPDWVDDQSVTGSGGGDGDYTPGPNHELSLIPAGLAPYPIDQKGRGIANDGTAVVGALQPAS